MKEEEREKRRKETKEKMVLYRCPYCGEANLKSLRDIKNNDIWECVFCGQSMVPA